MTREVRTLQNEVDKRLRALEEREERGVDRFAPPDAGPLATIQETAEEDVSCAPQRVEAGDNSRRRKLCVNTLDTGTFGMYAVAVAVHPTASTNGSVRAWCTSGMCLGFVLLQMFAFAALMNEADHPKCNSTYHFCSTNRKVREFLVDHYEIY